MSDTLNYPGTYKIEVSGWGLDNSFFVEKTYLLWSEDNGKHVRLHRTLPEGTIIFVRLVAPESLNRPIPVAYQVEGIKPMDSTGQCEMRLLQLCPRSKAPIKGGTASDSIERSSSARELNETSTLSEREEVIQ